MTGANVSRALAAARTVRVANVAYEVHLDLSAERGRPIQGSTIASFELASADDPLEFDFTPPLDHLASIVVNDDVGRVEPGTGEGRVQIAREYLRRGRNRIDFRFRAGTTAIHVRDDLMYSLFVPARASTALPCFDQPDLKARWTLTLTVPRGWTAVANGPETGRTATTGVDIVAFGETDRSRPTCLASRLATFRLRWPTARAGACGCFIASRARHARTRRL
jgi:aminopeptidase N